MEKKARPLWTCIDLLLSYYVLSVNKFCISIILSTFGKQYMSQIEEQKQTKNCYQGKKRRWCFALLGLSYDLKFSLHSLLFLNTSHCGIKILFISVLCLQIITYGLVFHKGSFCRSLFNILDLVVVAVSLISFPLEYVQVSLVLFSFESDLLDRESFICYFTNKRPAKMNWRVNRQVSGACVFLPLPLQDELGLDVSWWHGVGPLLGAWHAV